MQRTKTIEEAKEVVGSVPKKKVARAPRPAPMALSDAGDDKQSAPIRWRKIGGGTLRLKSGKRVKKGEIFSARAIDIPKSFRDTIIPLDPTAEGLVMKEEAPIEVEAPKYTIRPDEIDPKTFEVVDSNGKVVSEGYLTEKEAKALIRQLKG